jgi:hypothetical protein
VAEAVKLKITERDDIADLLGLIPTWMISAVVWYAFTKLVLDRLSPKKPGTEINLAIIAGDFLPDWISDSPADLPPGVKLAALIDVTLAALDVKDDIFTFLKEFPPSEIGKTGATTGVVLLDELLKRVTAGFLLITGLAR